MAFRFFRKPTPNSTPPMLRKLRIKFIGLNMALAALVMAASFAAICFADYKSDIDALHQSLTQAVSYSLRNPRLTPDYDPLLGSDDGIVEDERVSREEMPSGETATQNESGRNFSPAEGVAPHADPTPQIGSTTSPEGTASEMTESERMVEESGAMATVQDDVNSSEASGTDDIHENADGSTDLESSDWAPPQIGGEGEGTLPVAVYYVVGNAIFSLPERSSATVSESLLLQVLPEVLYSPDEWGYLPDAGLYFARRNAGRETLVAFADGSAATGWQSLAALLAMAELGALLLLFLLNLAFSRWALRPVQKAWNQQHQFVADASHELKTPLTVILANNAILRDHGNETIASQDQWLESTQIEAERMQGLVADMLDLARSDAVEKKSGGEPVDFSRLVEGEVLTFESVAFERGITWESTIEPDLMVKGDIQRLQRACGVLLDNACKYTETGGSVRVTLSHDDRNAELAVANTGEPIPAEDLPHLFDRFYRVDKARTHNAPAGYGLGLAIAHDIALAHKGTLGVQSTSYSGTVFTLTIPLA